MAASDPVKTGDDAVAAVLVAAGRGRRAGPGAPKQHRLIHGRSALERCLTALCAHPEIALVLTAIRPGEEDAFEAARSAAAARLGGGAAAAKILDPAPGGAERQETVRLALERLGARPIPPGFVAIHDAARPFLSQDVLDRLIAAARAEGAAAASLPVADTLRRAAEDGAAAEIAPRDGLWRAQTPQVFAFGPILAAHRAQAEQPATDDVEIARRAGVRTVLVEGSARLFKLTDPSDFDLAEALARGEEQMTTSQPPAADIRVGQGFDVHRFGPNADGSRDHVMLCGVRLTHETGLMGHSDADVGLHALTDAVLGAAALGDIGRHFPPTQERWRAAASDQFLAHAVDLARQAGGRPTLLDVTLICERPKIGPHVGSMRARIAEIARIELSRVSVKATTSEGLGFTGRGEGIAALATATLVF